ncbi:MAG TPA: glycosyltransferase family 87 protein [Ktedonobacterales bacterium]|nr:glycosyltransferase family 87 protein [Ktedonobacterales bacterium]
MSGRWRRVGVAIGWGAVIGWTPMSIVYANALRLSDGGDFGMYYAAAETLRYSPHANIYSLQTLAATVLSHGGCAATLDWPYPYQPLAALMLEPLTLLPCQDAAALWRFLNFGVWFGIAALLSFQAWRRNGSGRALLGAMTVLFFAPVLSGIHLGQTHLIVLVCMMAGIALADRDHDFASGAALGFGAVLKYVPAILMFYYLLRGRWRVGAGAAAVSTALVVVEGLIVGPRTLLESIGAGESDVRYYATLFQGGHWMSSLLAGVAIAYVAGAAFVSVVVWMRWGPMKRPVDERLGACWAITTALILSPLTWWFYLTWLLPAIMVCLEVSIKRAKVMDHGREWRSAAPRMWPFVVIALSYSLMLIPAYYPGVVNYRYMAAGTLLLWLLCGALYLWSAGVRLPDSATWRRLWLRQPESAASPEAAGVAAR